MIKITKKLLKEFDVTGGNSHLRKCEEWLTNGHWMIRRDKIKITPEAAALFESSLIPEHVNLMMERSKKARKAIRHTGNDTDCELAVTIFTSESKRIKVKFFAKYIEMAGVKMLKGTRAGSPWFAFDEKGMWFAITARRD